MDNKSKEDNMDLQNCQEKGNKQKLMDVFKITGTWMPLEDQQRKINEL